MRYLILRPGALGDLLVLRSALGLIRSHDPESHITLIAPGEKILFLKQQGWIDSGLNYHHKACSYLFSEDPEAKIPQELEFLKETDVAVCYLKDKDNPVSNQLKRQGVRQVLIHPSRPEPHNPVHLYDFLSLPFRRLGFSENSEPLYFIFSREQVLSALSPLNLELKNYFVIHPGSGSVSKNWNPEGFKEIIRRLLENNTVVCVGGEAETGLINDFRKNFGEKVKGLMKPDYPALACLLAGAAGYLGNDSGVSHLVSCVGLKNRRGEVDYPCSVVLFGPSSSIQWAPKGAQILHPSSNMKDIRIESVWEALKKSINKRGNIGSLSKENQGPQQDY